MKGDATTIKHLTQLLQNELTAINQYFLHARMYDNWGLTKLGKHEFNESIDEMKHADLLIQRILFLEGLPNLQELGRLMIGENVVECVQCDLKLEIKGAEDLRAAIKHAETVFDYVSRDLFITILKDEEGHIDHLETVLESIKLQGLENFIQLNSAPQDEAE